MAIDYSIIGRRLKSARNNKGFTQQDIAEKIDVSVAFLSRVERGSSHINLTRLSQLCDILEVSEGEVLNGTASQSKGYLTSEFNSLLKNCPPEKMKLIYNVTKTILENS